MDETKRRLISGTVFGFFQSLLAAFAMLVPAFYFTSLGISIVVYGFLLAIGDVFSFLLKPILGHLTDKYGEIKFLLLGIFVFILSLFLIGQTTSILEIAILKTISGVASALLFILIIIYALRNVSEKPDRKVGFFNGIKNTGWILGLLMPAILMDSFGISAGFYLILVVGLVWMAYTYLFLKKYPVKARIKVKPSFSFLKRIPLLVIYKTMDLAVFTTFLFFFTRYALEALGLSRSIVSIVVVVEIIAFAGSTLIIGMISNKQRRRYWVMGSIISHLIAATLMITASSLIHYFLVGVFIGIAGGFIDIWIYSRISETVKRYDKGKVMGTFGWSYDFATIVGTQVPVLFVLLNLNQFVSMYVFPIIMLIAYLLSRSKFNLK